MGEENEKELQVDNEIAEEEYQPIDFAKLLEKLVPPSSVVITDIRGKKITIPGAISARRQIKVFRKFKEIFDASKWDGMMNDLLDSDLAMSAISQKLIEIVSEENTMEIIGEIFTLAFPDVLEGEDPLDVLPIEEVVLALIPLSERFIKKAGTGVVKVMNEVLYQT